MDDGKPKPKPKPPTKPKPGGDAATEATPPALPPKPAAKPPVPGTKPAAKAPVVLPKSGAAAPGGGDEGTKIDGPLFGMPLAAACSYKRATRAPTPVIVSELVAFLTHRFSGIATKGIFLIDGVPARIAAITDCYEATGSAATLTPPLGSQPGDALSAAQVLRAYCKVLPGGVGTALERASLDKASGMGGDAARTALAASVAALSADTRRLLLELTGVLFLSSLHGAPSAALAATLAPEWELTSRALDTLVEEHYALFQRSPFAGPSLEWAQIWGRKLEPQPRVLADIAKHIAIAKPKNLTGFLTRAGAPAAVQNLRAQYATGAPLSGVPAVPASVSGDVGVLGDVLKELCRGIAPLLSPTEIEPIERAASAGEAVGRRRALHAICSNWPAGLRATAETLFGVLHRVTTARAGAEAPTPRTAVVKEFAPLTGLSSKACTALIADWPYVLLSGLVGVPLHDAVWWNGNSAILPRIVDDTADAICDKDLYMLGPVWPDTEGDDVMQHRAAYEERRFDVAEMTAVKDAAAQLDRDQLAGLLQNYLSALPHHPLGDGEAAVAAAAGAGDRRKALTGALASLRASDRTSYMLLRRVAGVANHLSRTATVPGKGADAVDADMLNTAVGFLEEAVKCPNEVAAELARDFCFYFTRNFGRPLAEGVYGAASAKEPAVPAVVQLCLETLRLAPAGTVVAGAKGVGSAVMHAVAAVDHWQKDRKTVAAHLAKEGPDVAAGVLIAFLTALPEPITAPSAADFEGALGLAEGEREARLKELMASLPQANRDTIAALLTTLGGDAESGNGMFDGASRKTLAAALGVSETLWVELTRASAQLLARPEDEAQRCGCAPIIAAVTRRADDGERKAGVAEGRAAEEAKRAEAAVAQTAQARNEAEFATRTADSRAASAEKKMAAAEAQRAQAVADNTKLAAEGSKLAAENGKLAAENARLNTENAKLREELARKASEPAKPSGDSEKMNAEVARLTAELEASKAELGSVTEEAGPLRQQVADLQAQHELEVANFEQVSNSLEAMLGSEDEWNTLRAALELRIGDLTLQLQASQAEAASLAAENESVKKAAANAAASAALLTSPKDLGEEVEAALSKYEASLREELAHERADNETLKAERDTLVRQFKKHVEDITQAHASEDDELRAEIASLREALEQARAGMDLSGDAGNVAALETQITQLRDDLSRERQEVSRLTRELATHDATAAAVHSVDEASTASALHEVDSLRRELQQARADLARATSAPASPAAGSVAAVQGDLARVQRVADELHSEMKNAKPDMDRLKQQFAESRRAAEKEHANEMASMRNDVERLQTALEEERARNEAMSEQFARDFSKHQAELALLRTQLNPGPGSKSPVAELAHVKGVADELSRELERLRQWGEERTAVLAELAVTREQLAAAKGTVESRDKELEVARAGVDDLRKDLKMERDMILGPDGRPLPKHVAVPATEPVFEAKHASEVAALVEEISALKKDKELLEEQFGKDWDAMQAQSASQTAEIDRLTASLKESEQRAAAAVQEREEQEKTFSADWDKQEHELKELKARLESAPVSSDASTSTDALKAEVASLKAKLDAVTQEKEEMEKTFSADWDKQESELKALKAQVASVSTPADHGVELEVLRVEVTTLKSSLAALAQEKDEMERTFGADWDRQEAELKSVKAQLAASSTQTGGAPPDEVESLKAQLASLTQAKEQLESTFSADWDKQEAEVKALREQVASAAQGSEEVDSLIARVAAVTQEKEELERTFSADWDKQEAVLKAQTALAEALARDKEEMQRTFETQQSELVTLRAQASGAGGDKASAESESAQLRARLATVTKEKEDGEKSFGEEWEKQEVELRALRAQLADTVQVIEGLAAARAELASVRADKDTMERTFGEDWDRQTAELSAARTELSAVKTELVVLKAVSEAGGDGGGASSTKASVRTGEQEERLSAENATLRDQLDKAGAVIVSMEQHFGELRDEITRNMAAGNADATAAANEELNASRARCASLSQEKAALERSFEDSWARQVAELAALKDQAAARDAELATLRAGGADAQGQGRDDFAWQLDEARAENRQLRESLANIAEEGVRPDAPDPAELSRLRHERDRLSQELASSQAELSEFAQTSEAMREKAEETLATLSQEFEHLTAEQKIKMEQLQRELDAARAGHQGDGGDMDDRRRLARAEADVAQVDALRAQLSQAWRTNDESSAALRAAEADRIRLQAALEAAERREVRLGAEVAALGDGTPLVGAVATSDVKRLRHIAEEAEARAVRAERDHAAARASAAAECGKLAEAAAQLKEKDRAKQAELERLRGEVVALRGETARWRAEADAVRGAGKGSPSSAVVGEAAMLRGEVERLTHANAQLTATNKRLQEAERKHDALVLANDRLRDANAQLRSMHESRTAETASARDSERHREAVSMKDKLAEMLAAENAALRDRVHHLSIEVGTLRGTASERKETIARLQAESDLPLRSAAAAASLRAERDAALRELQQLKELMQDGASKGSGGADLLTVKSPAHSPIELSLTSAHFSPPLLRLVSAELVPLTAAAVASSKTRAHAEESETNGLGENGHASPPRSPANPNPVRTGVPCLVLEAPRTDAFVASLRLACAPHEPGLYTLRLLGPGGIELDSGPLLRSVRLEIMGERYDRTAATLARIATSPTRASTPASAVPDSPRPESAARDLLAHSQREASRRALAKQRPVLGLGIANMGARDSRSAAGVVVHEVRGGFPGEAAGVRVDDIVTAVGDTPTPSRSAFTAALRRCVILEIVTLAIVRGDQVITVTATPVPDAMSVTEYTRAKAALTSHPPRTPSAPYSPYSQQSPAASPFASRSSLLVV